MNKNIYLLLIIFCCFSNNLIGQNFSENNIPKEHVFLHFNSSFLVTGESIYYKLYCLDTKTKRLSTLSKIAYVELIDSDLKSIFKHKIKLYEGTGFGDFFIPTTIASGNYKLIAYTQWMLNWSDIFFQNEISIINPFENNKKNILVEEKDSLYTPNTSLISPLKTVSINNKSKNDLRLSVDKKVYRKREKISFNILSNNPKNTIGNYSISVIKIDSIITPKMYSTKNYKQLLVQSNVKRRQFLPELRGELISGKVLDLNNNPSKNKKVAISIPGKNYIFKIATTNAKGNFYSYLNQYYKGDVALFQILDTNNDNLTILIDSIKGIDTKVLKFSDFKITQAMHGIILNRSIQSQIENSYSNVKLNVLDSLLPIDPFFKSKVLKTYYLDDYNRFPSVKETVVEIIPELFLRTRNKQRTFHVLVSKDRLNYDILPMLIIDGVLIQNHEELLAMNANSIKKIDVIASQYIYGTQIYEGIIAIETKSGNYKTTTKGNFIKYVNLFKTLVNKTYYKQIYQKNSQFDRIPDYRNLLLWEPNLNLSKKDNPVTFYSSDVPGYYQIRLEGFTEDGSPVSLLEVIEVN